LVCVSNHTNAHTLIITNIHTLTHTHAEQHTKPNCFKRKSKVFADKQERWAAWQIGGSGGQNFFKLNKSCTFFGLCVYLFACVRFYNAGVCVLEHTLPFPLLLPGNTHTHMYYICMLIFCCLVCSAGYFEEICISPPGNSAHIYIFHLKTSLTALQNKYLILLVSIIEKINYYYYSVSKILNRQVVGNRKPKFVTMAP